MIVIAVTQHGPNKVENEDRIIVGKTILSSGILQAELTSGILAVADGVGGNNAGAVASHFVACALSKNGDVSVEVISEINRALLAEAAADSELSGMATTLSAVCVGEKVQLAHVGNTRVYSLQNGKYLKQLIVDDTEVNYLVATGQLSPEDADTYDKRNVITACMGGGKETYFKLKTSDITSNHSPVLMLTSDGVHEYITMDDIEDTFDEMGLSVEACERIIEIARQNGSMDDASILIGVM